MTTSGGDFLAWAGDKAPGTGGISGIANDGAGDNVNTGSGGHHIDRRRIRWYWNR